MNLILSLIAVPIIAIMLSVSPAHAGKNKTDTAWTQEVKKVKGSIKDPAALAELKKMKSIMENGYFGMARYEFYELASKYFKKLTVLSAKHGGPKVSIPSWLDAH
ncbi:hypothetical protein OAJ57_03585 [Alphaproteobacteria bacterium]|nr:hypothetical protein [Alphaproteobacteria bacterium]